jgi:hypothetical protein
MTARLLLLARQLYRRRAAGIVIPYRNLDESHTEGQCHQNAGLWARENPGWKVVHGWLIFDYEKTSRGLVPLVNFNPHSVVEDPGGERFDPTPSRASARYPFLEHEGTAQDFIRLVQDNSLSILHYDVLADSLRDGSQK